VPALLLALIACGGDGGPGLPGISDARIGTPTGPNAALYFTASSDGSADRLIGAGTEAAAAVELHETTLGEDGIVGMRPIAGLALPSDGELILEPGGYHLMLVGVADLELGDTVEITLTWEEAGAMTLEAEVVDPADTMNHETSDG
jgi:hypothetical protein